MNSVEDTPRSVFQRALVFASGVNIFNLCPLLIFNNFICFNKVILRLGVGGRKQDKAYHSVCFQLKYPPPNFENHQH